MKIPAVTFSAVLIAFEIILLIIYGTVVDYEKLPAKPVAERNQEITGYYTQFQDVHVMIFMGFGFLMMFLKKYGYGSVGYTMIIAAVVIQWSMVLTKWLDQAASGIPSPHKVKLGLKNMITADFNAGAVLISFGAIIGKASRLQLIIMAIIESVFYAVNELILVHYIKITDIGGSMIIHMFGAYFGLAVALILRRTELEEEENSKEGSTPTSDLFSMLGTVFLWVFWPSFNGAMLGPSDQQSRAFLNTYISLAAACVGTFIFSPLVHSRQKLNMVHVQNATLAGGVAIGAVANLIVKPWGAMMIGLISGALCTLGYQYVTPFLHRKLSLHDTCGVHNLHGMPAVFSGIAAAIASAVADQKDYGADLLSIWSARGTRSKSAQGGYQFLAVLVTLGMSIVGGLITGLIMKYLDSPTSEQLFDDNDFWEVPEENAASFQLVKQGGQVVNGSQIELQVTTGPVANA